MSGPTLVAVHHRQLGERRFFHGQEIEPGLLEGELLLYWLDTKMCLEAPERRSLYKLFAPFSGAAEREQLSPNELALYGLLD